jgi:hypothetical protein
LGGIGTALPRANSALSFWLLALSGPPEIFCKFAATEDFPGFACSGLTPHVLNRDIVTSRDFIDENAYNPVVLALVRRAAAAVLSTIFASLPLQNQLLTAGRDWLRCRSLSLFLDLCSMIFANLPLQEFSFSPMSLTFTS